MQEDKGETVDYKQYILPIAAVLFFLVAAYFIYITFLPLTKPEVEENHTTMDTTAGAMLAKNILMKSLERGQDSKQYLYSYIEERGYFPTTVTLKSNASRKYVSYESALSKREIFFLENNETILCVTDGASHACSSVGNNSELKDYLNDARSLLASNTAIVTNILRIDFLIKKGAIVFDSAAVVNTTVDGRQCTRIKYTLDFSNLTLDDLSKIGMSPADPAILTTKVYNYTLCIDPQTYDTYELTTEYNTNTGPKFYRKKVQVVEWDKEQTIIPPENLTNGTAVGLLKIALDETRQVARCYNGDTAAIESCISNMGMNYLNEKICTLSGSKADFCLLVVATKRGATDVCKLMSQPEKTEACYFEVAAAVKNETYCDLITNVTMKQNCTDSVSRLVKPEENASNSS